MPSPFLHPFLTVATGEHIMSSLLERMKAKALADQDNVDEGAAEVAVDEAPSVDASAGDDAPDSVAADDDASDDSDDSSSDDAEEAEEFDDSDEPEDADEPDEAEEPEQKVKGGGQRLDLVSAQLPSGTRFMDSDSEVLAFEDDELGTVQAIYGTLGFLSNRRYDSAFGQIAFARKGDEVSFIARKNCVFSSSTNVIYGEAAERALDKLVSLGK